jgi:hypothetical protein
MLQVPTVHLTLTKGQIEQHLRDTRFMFNTKTTTDV